MLIASVAVVFRSEITKQYRLIFFVNQRLVNSEFKQQFYIHSVLMILF